MKTRNQAKMERSAWHVMPQELLTEVFAYLPASDRLNARATCRHWKEILKSPEFWRQREFSIRGEDDAEGSRISQYMDLFGEHLQDLTISVMCTSTLMMTNTQSRGRMISDELQLLLKARRQQLRSFTCHNLCNLAYLKIWFKLPWERAVVMSALRGMLEQQTRLTAVTITESYLKEPEGCQILGALGNPDIASKLTSLCLRKFYSDDGDHALWNYQFCFSQHMGRFKMLETCGLSWHYLGRHVLTTLTDNCLALKRVLLYERPSERNYRVVLPDWQTALTACPELRVGVDVALNTPHLQCRFKEFLVPLIPLACFSLDMTNVQGVLTDRDVANTLAEVSRCISRQYLRAFLLKLPPIPIPWSRPKALVKMVKAFPSLTLLCLQLHLSLETLVQLAAAAHPLLRKEEGERSAPSSLHLHVADCDRLPDGRVQEWLEGVNPCCAVRVCQGCQPLLSKPDFV